MQPAVRIDRAERSERLHHRLLVRLRMVGAVQHHIAVCQHRLYIALAAFIMRAEIPLIIRAHLTERLPVFLRMHQHRMIHCCAEIQHRLKHLIRYFDQAQRAVHTFFIFSCHDSHRIPDKPHMAVQHQAVLRTRLRIRLSRQRKARPVLRHVFPRKDRFNPGYFHRRICPDLFDDRIRVWGTQQLHDKTVCGSNIIRIDRLPRQKLHGVFFPYRLIYCLHEAPPFFFHSRKFRIPRSCPS